MKPVKIKLSKQVRSMKDTIYSGRKPYERLENSEEGSGENKAISKMTESKRWQE